MPAGQVVAVVGRSGAGKTTLLRTLAGELPPRAGSVHVAGGAPRFPEVALADQFPERQFFATTVAEEVSFAARALGRAVRPEGVREGLEGVGLDAAMASRSPWTLSVGEQRRVAIASLLVVEPRVLLLDEPTASLDGCGRADLGALVRAFRARGGTVVMAGHDWMWSLPLADRAWVVGAGA